MYAVIAHGGKQYRVAAGDRLRLEKIDAKAGEAVEFDRVLMVADGDRVDVGPAAAGRKVTGSVVSQTRGAKVIVFKKKRRKQYRRTRGHRQYLTEIRVERID